MAIENVESYYPGVIPNQRCFVKTFQLMKTENAWIFILVSKFQWLISNLLQFCARIETYFEL